MNQFKNILYVAQTSMAHEHGLAQAVSLADSNQAMLTVIDVVPLIPAGAGMPHTFPSAIQLQAEAVNKRHSELESLLSPHQRPGRIRIEVLVGQMFLEVIRAVLRNKHDLLLKPAENPGFIERLFGSDDMHLLRKCPCPVWLMRPDDKPNCSSILAAVDFNLDTLSDTAEHSLNHQILSLASALALSDQAKLHVVHVWDAPAEMTVRAWADNPEEAGREYVEGERTRHERALTRLRGQLEDLAGKEACSHLSPQFHLYRGAASKVIPQLVDEYQADLVVMGTVARTGIAGLFIGNTAETILEQLQCSVLAVKPQGFVTPVKLPE